MIGHLHLDCSAGDTGTYLSAQSFAAPMHLSKPYWDGTALIINAVNPTAGFFGDDVVDVQLRVKTGAHTVFTSPSATLVHRVRSHQAPILLTQKLVVARSAWLDYCPEMTIPHAGSRFVQNTTIDLEAGAELFFQESWAPGRVVRGETFAFDSIRCVTELNRNSRLELLERYTLQQGDKSLHPLTSDFPEAYHSMAILVTDQIGAPKEFLHAIAKLSNPSVRCGGSFVSAGICVIKVLASGSLALRATHRSLRQLIYSTLGRPLPQMRKL